jgi:hypothetical protein
MEWNCLLETNWNDYCAFSDMTDSVFIYSNSTSANIKIKALFIFKCLKLPLQTLEIIITFVKVLTHFLDLKYGYWQ